MVRFARVVFGLVLICGCTLLDVILVFVLFTAAALALVLCGMALILSVTKAILRKSKW